MKAHTLLLIAALLSGCIHTKPHRVTEAPSASVTLTQVRLQKLSDQLEQAGQKNASVEQRLDKAQQLAEQLSVLLDQVEKETNTNTRTP